jgi:hypothetical protein
MLPLRSCLLAIALVLAASQAGASWFETGFVEIVANLAAAEAEDIEPGDVIDSVQIGSATESGELTVVSEGDVNTRQSLGFWQVFNGQGNIQSTFGSGGAFRAETGNFPTPTDAEIDVLNSDIAGNFLAGERGTVRLTASAIEYLTVADGGGAYLSMGARAGILTTRTGAYVQIDESSIVGFLLQSCRLMETTIVVRDSLFSCANVDLSRATDMDVFPNLTPFSEFRVEEALRMDGATLDVSGGVAFTGGKIELSPTTTQPTALRVAGTEWVNEGTFEFTRFGDGPAELLIGGGSQFLQKGTMKVRSQAGANGLVVTGAGTELDAESDLLVGQTVVGVQTPTVPGTLTVGSGGVVIVRGTLVIGPMAVLNLDEGGTIYASATEIHGTVNENGGVLIVPEAEGALAGLSAAVAVALLRLTPRSRRSPRCDPAASRRLRARDRAAHTRPARSS